MLLNFGKLWYIAIYFTIFFFFFVIADLKNFTWCNVIQQIEKVSPNYVLELSSWHKAESWYFSTYISAT